MVNYLKFLAKQKHIVLFRDIFLFCIRNLKTGKWRHLMKFKVLLLIPFLYTTSSCACKSNTSTPARKWWTENNMWICCFISKTALQKYSCILNCILNSLLSSREKLFHLDLQYHRQVQKITALERQLQKIRGFKTLPFFFKKNCFSYCITMGYGDVHNTFGNSKLIGNDSVEWLHPKTFFPNWLQTSNSFCLLTLHFTYS